MTDVTERVLEEVSNDAPRRWSGRVITTFVASVLGIGVSTYLTLVHFTSVVSLSCPGTGKVINCEKVTTSPESYFVHIPVSVLGLAFFVPMLVLSLPWAWHSPIRLIAPTRLVMALIGIIFVFRLVYAELFQIKAICLWCTSVHVLTFVLFVAIATGWDEATDAWYAEDDL